MKKPIALMRNLDVNFVSLVDKGANKQKFEIFKSEDGKPTEENKDTNVKKYYDECYEYGSFGSSFQGAMQAIDTQEKLSESRWKMDEGFYILKMVMKGVLEDDTIKDKPSGLEKAIKEFEAYTVNLFKGLPIQKASEMLNLGGDMKNKGKNEATAVDKAMGSKEAGVSANKVPDAQNRKGDNVDVAGVSGKAKMKKSFFEDKLEKAKKKVKEMEDKMTSKNKDEMSKSLDEVFEEIEWIESEISAIEKAVGDRTEGAPATGEDTVSKNGEEATDGEENSAETGDTSGAVAKEDGQAETETPSTEVVKDDVGMVTPDTASAQDMNNKHDVSLDGKVGGIVEQFKKTMEVSLEGSLKGVTDLIKGIQEKVDGLEAKVNKTEETVTKSSENFSTVTKMHGLSNAFDSDYEESEEVKKNKADLKKSEDELWASGTDSLGSLKGSK